MMKQSLKGLMILAVVAVLVVGIAGPSAAKDAKEYKFMVTQGWIDNPSAQAMKRGYEDAVKEMGGKIVSHVSANYDAKLQADQIEGFIKAKPDAILIAAADTKAISVATRRAVEAGIPVFCGDSLVAGAGANSTIFSNNFGMGAWQAEWVCKRLGGKGKIGAVHLPSNETWDMRTLGLYWTLRQYPDIKLVANWAFNPSGNVKPRQAIDNMLTANPGKDAIQWIWCAWDGAAMEGALSIKAAGRESDIGTSGIDGGSQAFEYIKTGTPMKLSLAQSMYQMAYMGVYYAHEVLAGKPVPRIVITPTYAVTEKELKDVDPKKVGDTYDIPGVATKLGWERVL